MFFFRVVNEPREERLQRLITGVADGACVDGVYPVEPEHFSKIPGSPFAYWIPESVRNIFQCLPPFESSGRAARQGASTVRAFRHLRLWWEYDPRLSASSRTETNTGKRWLLFAKGGRYSPYYYDIELAFDWLCDGAPVKAEIAEWRGSRGWGYQWSATLNGHDEYLRPGLTWPSRTQSRLALRAMPSGCIFADKGPGAFVENNDEKELLALLAVCNSSIFRGLAELLTTFGAYGVGVIQRVPVPRLSENQKNTLAELAQKAWRVKRHLDTCEETSHVFVAPAVLQVAEGSLQERIAAWEKHTADLRTCFDEVQLEVDRFCLRLYGQEHHEADWVSGFNSANAAEPEDEYGDQSEDETVDDADTASETATDLIQSLFSWSVGVAFGRFDVRIMQFLRDSRLHDNPFAPLPPCSPCMLVNETGLPIESLPEDYPIGVPPDGVLIDDPGHASDILFQLSSVLAAVFGEGTDDRLEEAVRYLQSLRADMRLWLQSSFFDLHLKQYSKSRRKAPIYWQLATSSASYSVWLYYHRFSRDTFYKVLNDYVTPKLQHEERKLTHLCTEAGANPTTSQRKEIADQAVFVEELRTFRDEVARVAPLWNPNLNDGVIINFTPLWRLVPQHRAWQKECKDVWDKLVKGDYDWVHLAMHLWPERVVPKCRTDRSLAIAHGLEEVFWEEDKNGKWIPKDVSNDDVETLVCERTSPAVKAALESLLSVPAPVAGRGRGGNRQADRGRRRSSTASVGDTANRATRLQKFGDDDDQHNDHFTG